MQKVMMYCAPRCRYCMMAEKLLEKKGVTDIEKVFVGDGQESREEMIEKTGRRTVPQVYVGETHVGGYDDLAEMDRKGELDKLLTG